MTATLHDFLQAYEEAGELIASIAAQIKEISEGLARLRRTVHMRVSGLRIALGKEPLLEEEGGHEQAMQEISPAEPLAFPAEAEETTWTPADEASAESDEAVGIVISGGDAGSSDVVIDFGDGISIVEDSDGGESIL